MLSFLLNSEWELNNNITILTYNTLLINILITFNPPQKHHQPHKRPLLTRPIPKPTPHAKSQPITLTKRSRPILPIKNVIIDKSSCSMHCE